MFLINLFLKIKDKTLLSTVEQNSLKWVRDSQEDFCLKAAISHPCCIHLAEPPTIVWSDMLSWLPHKVIFSVPLTVQVLLVQSGILFHCGFHEYRGNSWRVPGTRKSKASQWWKMGLRSCLSRVNCRSESQTYHLSYLPLGEKKIVLSSVCHCWYLPGLLFRAVYISRSFVIVLWKYGVVSWLARKSAMLL